VAILAGGRLRRMGPTEEVLGEREPLELFAPLAATGTPE
jgi:molybdopterin-guanine dinucleotide biosynthesis protein A